MFIDYFGLLQVIFELNDTVLESTSRLHVTTMPVNDTPSSYTLSHPDDTVTRNLLFIEQASPEDSGLYSCSLEDTLMAQTLVEVTGK